MINIIIIIMKGCECGKPKPVRPVRPVRPRN